MWRFYLLLWGLTATSVASGADLPSPGAKAVGTHSASTAAITNLKAKVNCEVSLLAEAKLPPVMEANRAAHDHSLTTGEFIRSGHLIRINETASPHGARTLLKDLLTRQGTIHVERDKRKPAQMVTHDHHVNSNLDLSNGIIYFLPRPVPPDYETHVPLERAIEKARKVAVRRDTVDGAETVCLDLDLDGDGSQFQVWLDPKVNYLWSRVMATTRGKPSIEIRVMNFAEIKPGVFCPARVERVVSGFSKTVLTLSDIRIDDSGAPKTLIPPLPPGSQVSNHLEGKVYEVGANEGPGKVVGRLVPRTPDGIVPPSATPATPLLADAPGWWSWSRIVLVVSAAVGIMAGIVWYRRRRHRIVT